MITWAQIEAVLHPSADDIETAAELYEAFQNNSIKAITQSSLINITDAAISAFYASIEKSSKPIEALSKNSDSSWICNTDIAWINVRATATKTMLGTFIRATKILPSLTAKAILLAPFHPNQFDLCYAPETMTLVDPAFCDEELTKNNISHADQVRAFVLACRLLGKTVGYELLPYVSQFSRVAMEMPYLFRWIALDEARTGLKHADPSAPYTAKNRLRDAEEVALLVATAKDNYNVTTFRTHESDNQALAEAKQKAYYSAIRLCIEHGLWPVPAHAWGGVGVPAFHKYDGDGDFPVFTYKDYDGLDVSRDAYSVLSPFAFYDNMPVNNAPSNVLPKNQAAIDYYTNVFSYWRDSFGFDFVRYNASDRIFDEAYPGNDDIPTSDRPTASIVSMAIKASRNPTKGVAAISSFKGSNILQFNNIGFDLTMGNEVMRRMDSAFFNDAINLYKKLTEVNTEQKKMSVCFALDVPESAAPRLWGAALHKVMGRERMQLRHAFARFLSVGKGQRPMFETMGFQDGSTGLYEAGLSQRGLDWANDEKQALSYAAIENLFCKLKPFMSNAKIDKYHSEASYAWWQIHDDTDTRLIIAIASLETADGHAPGSVTIPIDMTLKKLQGTMYKLPNSIGTDIYAVGQIHIELGFLDFVVIDLYS